MQSGTNTLSDKIHISRQRSDIPFMSNPPQKPRRLHFRQNANLAVGSQMLHLSQMAEEFPDEPPWGMCYLFLIASLCFNTRVGHSSFQAALPLRLCTQWRRLRNARKSAQLNDGDVTVICLGLLSDLQRVKFNIAHWWWCVKCNPPFITSP